MRDARPLATLALACVAAFAAGIAALHALEPQLAPMEQPMSAYGISSSAWLFTLSLVVVSVGIGAFAGVLAGALPPGVAKWVAAGLAGVAGVGILLAGLFPMDAPATGPTFAGAVHGAGATVGFVSGTLVVFAVAAAVGNDARWRGLRWPALALGLAAAATLGLLQAGPPTLEGLFQRLLTAAVLGGVVVVCLRARGSL